MLEFPPFGQPTTDVVPGDVTVINTFVPALSTERIKCLLRNRPFAGDVNRRTRSAVDFFRTGSRIGERNRFLRQSAPPDTVSAEMGLGESAPI